MMKLAVLAVACLCACQSSHAQSALDMSKIQSGNTLGSTGASNVQAKPDSFEKVQKSIADDEKIECDADGCTFHTTECKGKEFRIGASGGEGQDPYGYGTGVSIYTGDSQTNGINYNLSVTYTTSNFTNKVKIDRSLYEFIKTNLMLASTKEHAKASMDQRDPAVSKELELALSAAVAMNGTACTDSATSNTLR